MQTFRADCLLKTRGRPVSPWAATHQPRSRITHFIRPRPMLVCRRFSKEPKQAASEGEAFPSGSPAVPHCQGNAPWRLQGPFGL